MAVTLCPAVFLPLSVFPDLGALSGVILRSGVMLAVKSGVKLDGSLTESD